jgi:hypothetical protein
MNTAAAIRMAMPRSVGLGSPSERMSELVPRFSGRMISACFSDRFKASLRSNKTSALAGKSRTICILLRLFNALPTIQISTKDTRARRIASITAFGSTTLPLLPRMTNQKYEGSAEQSESDRQRAAPNPRPRRCTSRFCCARWIGPADAPLYRECYLPSRFLPSSPARAFVLEQVPKQLWSMPRALF